MSWELWNSKLAKNTASRFNWAIVFHLPPPMKTKTLVPVVLAVLVVSGAVLYATGSLGSLQGRFGGITGGVTLTLDAGTPREDIVVAGDADVEVSSYELTANKEDFVITKLQINNRGTAGDMDNNISSVTLRYEDSSGSTVEETGVLVTGVASFAGLDLYVPKDDTAELTILVDLNNISYATAGEKIQLYVSATGLEAVGQTSGKTVTVWSGSAPRKPNLMHVYETKPTLSLASSSPSGARLVSATDDVFTFTVTADSGELVKIKNTKILLTSDGDFDTTAVSSATLEDKTGATVGSARVSFTDSSNAYVQFNFSTPLEVPKSDFDDYTLTLDTATILDDDSGVDDPLTVSIKLGSSTSGTVSAGGFKWNDTNADVTWVGNVSSTTLTGNTLIY